MYRPCLPVIPMTSGTSTNSNPGSTTDDFPSGLTSIASSDAVKQETIYNCECNSSSGSSSTRSLSQSAAGVAYGVGSVAIILRSQRIFLPL